MPNMPIQGRKRAPPHKTQTKKKMQKTWEQEKTKDGNDKSTNVKKPLETKRIRKTQSVSPTAPQGKHNQDKHHKSGNN